MRYDFTFELLNRKGRFIAEIEARAEVNISQRLWSIDDVEIVTWKDGASIWATPDSADPVEREIERQARAYLGKTATRYEIDARVGEHWLEAGVYPVPEYEHLTGFDYGLRP